jgi:hypothetical protein
VRFGICVGDGVCASWGGDQVGFASWGGQARVVKVRCSRWGVQSRGVQDGCCEFLVSIH